MPAPSGETLTGRPDASASAGGAADASVKDAAGAGSFDAAESSDADAADAPPMADAAAQSTSDAEAPVDAPPSNDAAIDASDAETPSTDCPPGQCSPLVRCERTGSESRCGDCPAGYGGSGETGCSCTPAYYGTIPAADLHISALAVYEAGNRLYAYSEAMRALLAYDATTLEPLAPIAIGYSSAATIVVDEHHGKVYVGGYGPGAGLGDAIAVVDAAGHALVRELPGSGFLRMIGDPTRHRIYASSNSTVQSVDVETDQVTFIRGVPGANASTSLAIDTLTGELLVGNWSQANNALHIVDPDRLEVTTVVPDLAGVGVAFNPLENKVYIAQCAGRVPLTTLSADFCIYDRNDGSVARLQVGNAGARTFAFNPKTGRMLSNAAGLGNSTSFEGDDEWFNVRLDGGGELAVRHASGNAFLTGYGGTYAMNPGAEIIANFPGSARSVVIAQATGRVYSTGGGDITVIQDRNDCVYAPWPERVQVAGGNGHMCRVNSDGSVYCWGGNSYGESSPPPGTFRRLTAGGYHTCGLRFDGSVACWGYPDAIARTPSAPMQALSAAMYGTCGVRTDGRITCWGSTGPDAPSTGSFGAIAMGFSHGCALNLTGHAACWGSDPYGASTPPLGTFSAITAGNSLSCGLRPDGSIECWGSNMQGQASAPSGTFTAIDAALGSSGNHACALRTDGEITCWGEGSFKQTAVLPGPYVGVLAEHLYSCGRRADAVYRCWGRSP